MFLMRTLYILEKNFLARKNEKHMCYKKSKSLLLILLLLSLLLFLLLLLLF